MKKSQGEIRGYTHVHILWSKEGNCQPRVLLFIHLANLYETWSCYLLGTGCFFFCLFFVFLSPFIPFIFYRDLTAKVSHKQRVYICILTRMLTTANAPPPPSLSNSSPLLPHYFFYLRSSKQLGNSKERPTTIRNNNNNQRVVHLFCMYCQLIDYQLFYTIYCTHISFL